MGNVILTKEWNCDRYDVVELPSPFNVSVSFDKESGCMEVNFHETSEYLDAGRVYHLSLFVPDEYHELAEYLDIHSCFTNFTSKVAKYIVDDIIHFMKTGFYYDDDDDDIYDFEPYESFSLDYYEQRWEEYIENFLKNPSVHYSDADKTESVNETISAEEDKESVELV